MDLEAPIGAAFQRSTQRHVDISREEDDPFHIVGANVVEDIGSLVQETVPFISAGFLCVGEKRNGRDDQFDLIGAIRQPALEGGHLFFADHFAVGDLFVQNAFRTTIHDKEIGAAAAECIPVALERTLRTAIAEGECGTMARLVDFVGVDGVGVFPHEVLLGRLSRPIVFDFVIVKGHIGGHLAHQLADVWLRESAAITLRESLPGLIGVEGIEIVCVNLIADHEQQVGLGAVLDLVENREKGLVAAIIEEFATEQAQQIAAGTENEGNRVRVAGGGCQTAFVGIVPVVTTGGRVVGVHITDLVFVVGPRIEAGQFSDTAEIEVSGHFEKGGLAEAATLFAITDSAVAALAAGRLQAATPDSGGCGRGMADNRPHGQTLYLHNASKWGKEVVVIDLLGA